MEIETKFSMGEDVWTMHENKATSLKVTSITLGLTHRVNKYFTSQDVHVQRPQDKVFKTKEELLNSL